MVRNLIAAATLAIAGIAHAQAPVVTAVPANAISGKIVVGDVLWACSGAACTTARITARPAIACAQVVKQIGAVSSFAVGETALNAEDLAKCNARAKAIAAMAAN
ncbi:MAG: CC_3452 family protein [Sphingomonadaceae bacterium]